MGYALRKKKPYTPTFGIDLSDGVLNHPRCVICQKYIPEDRIPASDRIPQYCSVKCRDTAYTRRKRALKDLQHAV